MGKLDLKSLYKLAKSTVSEHSPEVLMGLGIAGVVGTVVIAIKDTPKAIRICEELKAGDAEPTKIDYVKACWKCYIPTAVAGTISIACLLGSNSVNNKRNAALAAAYTLTNSDLIKYKEKVKEVIGGSKEKDIRDSVAKDRIKEQPVVSREVIITEKGNTLCYDTISGRYFKSDMDTIKRAFTALNREILYGDMYVSLNDFYDQIGLPHVKIGDGLGWNVDSGTIDADFSSHLAEDGTPCLVIDYTVAPKYDYSKFM